MSSITIVTYGTVLIFIFLAGYFFGKWKSTAAIKSLIKDQTNFNLLGQRIKSAEEKKSVAKCYYESGTALKDMDEYPLTGFMIPTPFLNYAPAPTKEKNLQINSNQFRSNEDIVSPKPNDAF